MADRKFVQFWHNWYQLFQTSQGRVQKSRFFQLLRIAKKDFRGKNAFASRPYGSQVININMSENLDKRWH